MFAARCHCRYALATRSITRMETQAGSSASSDVGLLQSFEVVEEMDPHRQRYQGEKSEAAQLAPTSYA